jgi:diguanylate cyclase (GGDEF)-like protein
MSSLSFRAINEGMRPPFVVRAASPAVRQDARIGAQIRRFALLWLAASVGVLGLVAVTSLMAGRYRDEARASAAAAVNAQLAVGALQHSVDRQSADILYFHMTGAEVYRTRFDADSAATRRSLLRLRTTATRADSDGSDRKLLNRTVTGIARWDAGAAAAFATRHTASTHPTHDTVIASDVSALERNLARLNQSLARDSKQAVSSSEARGHIADVARQIATLVGLVILFAGGVRLLRRASSLAGDADARNDREARWAKQVEAVLAWSVRAKSAATRSQLIGFAHMIPNDAVGATCLMVAEGGAPPHRSHGRPRVAMVVDDAGAGLHISVCFAEGRGDGHDHHALDLLIGHLAALWRTVLRQEELEQAAGHDALTGLPNRRAFEAELRRRVALSKRRGFGFTLAIADLDHFKQVNDTFGHPEGDSVLRRAGEAIRSTLRTSDRVFRVGGEEFALILETGDPAGVEEILERSRIAVKALEVRPDPTRHMSASIGWAVFPEDADDKADLIAQADAALYRAKTGGRDRVIRVGQIETLAG